MSMGLCYIICMHIHIVSPLATYLFIHRNDDIEVDCYCNEHYVMQHDILRMLAIFLSNKEPIEQRKRLIMDLPNSMFDKSQLPIHARLLSISTGLHYLSFSFLNLISFFFSL